MEIEEQDQIQEHAKRMKHVPEYTRGEVISQFMKDVIDKNYVIFGGAVRDFVAGVEPVDVDIYIECLYSAKANLHFDNFISVLDKYSFTLLVTDEDINWTHYKKFPAVVVHYMVEYSGISFKVDIVASRIKPCFGKLDCIVNGLYMDKNGISFVDHERISHVSNHDLVFVAKKLIVEREAGILPDCNQHRIEKMASKGYNINVCTKLITDNSDIKCIFHI